MNTAEFIITTDNIRKWSGSAVVYQRGEAYFRQRRVSRLLYEPDENKWHAEVEGSEDYDVEVALIKNGVEAYCDCQAFDSYDICKHVVAVLFEIQHRYTKRNWYESEDQELDHYKMANELLDFLGDPLISQRSIEQDNYKQPLSIEYICKRSSGNLLSIELKAGTQRTFVVKDIGKFLQSIEHGTSFSFTNKFSYEPSTHYLLQEDQEIFGILQDMRKQEEFYNRQHMYRGYYLSQPSQRAMVIPPSMANRLFSRLQDRKMTIEGIGNLRFIPFMNEKDVPMSFRLEKGTSEDFLLDLSAIESSTYLQPYAWIIRGNTIYQLTNEQKEIVDRLYRLWSLSKHSMVPVGAHQIGELISTILPRLNRIGQVEIAERVSREIISPKLQPKVFVDLQNDRLVARLEFHYGDIVIEPYRPARTEEDYLSGIILMRQMETEQKILNLFKTIPFVFHDHEAYLEDEERIYDFLFRSIPMLDQFAEIYMSSTVKSIMLPKQQTPMTRIDLESGSNLLEITFTIEGIDRGEIKHILQSVKEKKKYYKLPSGAFLSLEDEAFQTVDRLLSELPIPKGQLYEDRLVLPIYRGLQINEIIGQEGSASARFGKRFRRLIQELKHPDTLDFPLPESLNATLRDYQEFGFSWLKTMGRYQIGGILADDMGLGKTVQAIAYLLSEKQDNQGGGKPSLVISPASLVYNWKSEFEKFAPEMNIAVAYGPPEERLQLLQNGGVDVLITSYPLLRQDIEYYQKMRFDSLILDEAQAIKNHLTKTAKAVKHIHATKRFALSGTPIENALDELWSIFDVILPGFFQNNRSFRNLDPERIAHLVRPFILRRVKQEVLKELPDKIETVHRSELTKQQKELYLGYLERIQAETKETLETEGFEKSRIKILAGLTRLRQLCCHPSLFLENYEGGSGKLEQLLEIIENALENKRRMLIFSQFTTMLQMIREQLKQADVNYFYLDGQTPSKERVDMADRFNEGECEVFLISLKAGGTGLNLTGADTVILYDLWWNPAVEEQAAGRAHRMGQKNSVQVIRLVTQGTIEEKIYEMQQKKKDLIEQVISTGESSLSSFSEAEIREILGI